MKLKILPLFVMFFITGCSSMIMNSVKTQLNMNEMPPSFPLMTSSSQAGEEGFFYAQALSDVGNGFSSFKGKMFSAKEKNKKANDFINNFKKLNDRQVKKGIYTRDIAYSAVNAAEKASKEGMMWHLNKKPRGVSGHLGKTNNYVAATNSKIESSSIVLYYPIKTKQQGRIKIKQLSDMFNRVIQSREKWIVKDIVGMRNDYVKLNNQYQQVSQYTRKSPPYNYAALAEGSINYLSFDYRWDSKLTGNINGMVFPKMNMLVISAHNNLEGEYNNYQNQLNGGNLYPGSFVVVSISKVINKI